jgi:hypothetical protein
MNIKIIVTLILILALPFNANAANWKQIADNIISDYDGDITSIEQLTSSTCWVVVPKSTTNNRAIQVAESVGFYIRNVTGFMQGHRPTVRIFRNDQHIAVATPNFSNKGFEARLDLKDWGTKSFNGEYRP